MSAWLSLGVALSIGIVPSKGQGVRCSALSEPIIGYYFPYRCGNSSDPPTYLYTCELVCNKGYVISSQDMLECQADGSWSTQKVCQRPEPDLEHVEVKGSGEIEIEFSLTSDVIATIEDGKDQMEVKICQKYQDEECVEHLFDVATDETYLRTLVVNNIFLGKLRIWLYHLSKGESRSKPSRTEITRKPNIPDIDITPGNWPMENTILANWTRLGRDYSGVEIRCNSTDCCQDITEPILVFAPKRKQRLEVRTGTECLFILRTFIIEDEAEGRKTYSSGYQETVVTKPSPPRSFRLFYTNVKNTRNIRALSMLKLYLEVGNGIGRNVFYSMACSIVNQRDNTSTEFDYFTISNPQTKVYNIQNNADNHLRPGALYKTVLVAVGARNITSPPLTSYMYVAPYPPENFTINSDPASPIKTFKWMFHSNSTQNEAVLKFCLPENHTICIYEEVLKGADFHLPVKYRMRPRIAEGTYAVYLIARSGGKNSSASNFVTVGVAPTCKHPDGLNGQIRTSNKTSGYYFLPGDSYSLVCDEGFKLSRVKAVKGDVKELTWSCRENGRWDVTTKCAGSVNTTFLLTTTGGSLGVLIIISAFIFLGYKCKVKGVNETKKSLRREIKQIKDAHRKIAPLSQNEQSSKELPYNRTENDYTVYNKSEQGETQYDHSHFLSTGQYPQQKSAHYENSTYENSQHNRYTQQDAQYEDVEYAKYYEI